MSETRTRLNVRDLLAKKRDGQKIAMLTAYDFTMARLLDEAGVDCLLVGDSLSMVVQGHATTLPVTLDQMIYHGEMVCRAVGRAFVIVDMPFLSYQTGTRDAILNAGRILKETGCQAVKLEGASNQAEIIRGLVDAGIPVMAHVGLRPQSINTLGTYKVQRDGEQLTNDAQAAAQAGAFAVLIECVSAALAGTITQALSVPTIGIGAGPDCDGQVLVTNDLLGITSGYVPKFAKQYVDLKSSIQQAVQSYQTDVEEGRFPGKSESYR